MLALDGVSVTYRIGTFGSKALPAVRSASFHVDRGEVVSLIGESGSGKSTIGRAILRLLEVTRGDIRLDGEPVAALDRKRYYGRVQGVFQDPFSAFNPIFKVDRVFAMLDPAWEERIDGALAAVGLDARQVLGRYAHQLSGGQLQRLLVARALLLEIDYLVADEVTSMLDASTRIDVLNLLADLRERGLGVLFITHDLSLGNYISDRTVILRRGAIVELGETEQVYRDPRHPYTRTLLDSVPRLHERWRGAPPELETGERSATAPPLVEVVPGHFVAGDAQ